MLRTVLLQRAKTHSALLLNTGSLASTTIITFVFGFPYWWLAARQFPPAAVGFASAIVSAMTLLASIAILGWGTLLIGELPRQPGKEIPLVSAALTLVGGIGGGLGIVFAVVAPFILTDFQILRASVVDVALFAVGVSLTSIATVLEGALIGLWRGDLILWRSTLFSAAKLAALFLVSLWLSYRGGLTIYATWTAGNALSLGALAVYAVFKGRGAKRSYLPHWGLLRKLTPLALQHHILNWILGIPVLVAPMLITTMLSAEVNAWYYIAGSIASLASVIPTALVFVGFTAGCAEPDDLAHKMRVTVSLSFVAALLADVVLLAGARQILSLFGQSYADQAVWCLRILALGAFPLIIKNHYIVLYRIWGRVAFAILPITAGVLLEIGVIVLGARLGGLLGLSLGWIAAIYVESICMFPTVYKSLRLRTLLDLL